MTITNNYLRDHVIDKQVKIIQPKTNMKKLITSIMMLAFVVTMANAQTCTLSENFTAFTGVKTALPSGWRGANLSTTAGTNVYTTVASSGPSGVNAFKFGVTAATLYSPNFTVGNNDSVSFWAKNNGITDTVTRLEVFAGADTITMTLIKTIKKISFVGTAGNFFVLPLNSSIHALKFVYTKVAGNMSFDDFCVKSYPAPCAAQANFTFVTDTMGLVHFTSTSTGALPNFYYWNFADGNTTDSVATTNHSYLANGTYNVTLYMSNGVCADSITKIVTVTSVTAPACTLGVTFNSTNDSAGTVSFVAMAAGNTGAITYNWNFGDAGTGTSANPSHTYTTNGNYTITVIASDSVCADTLSLPYSVSSVPVVTPPAGACYLSQNFNTYSGASTALPAGWRGANLLTTGNSYTTIASSGPSGANSFKFQTGLPTGTVATLYAPNFNASNNDSVTFWVKANSMDTISKLEIFAGADTITMALIKTIKKNDIAIAGQFFTLPLNASYHALKFAYTKSGGNMSFDDFCVKSYGSPCALKTNYSVVTDTMGTVSFVSTTTNNTSTVTYSWTLGDGSTATSANVTHTYATNGTYNVAVTATDSLCSTTYSQVITVNSIPVVPCNLVANFQATYDTAGVVHFLATTTGATGNVTYGWSLGTGSATGSGNPFDFTYTSNGNYNVTLVAQDSVCANTVVTNITVTSVPVAPCNADFTYTFSSAGIVNFNSTSTNVTANTNYTWDYGNGTTDVGPTSVVTYTANGTYNVLLTITDTATQCNDTVNYSIVITTINAPFTCVESEDFTTFTGSASALPFGWVGANLSTSATGNAYTTATSAGVSGPNSFKFGTNMATLITPYFTVDNGDSVAFWLKANSLDAVSKLDVFVGNDTINMALVKTIVKADIATAGQTMAVALDSTRHFVKFVYTKSAGNLAFDDYCVRSYNLNAPTNIKTTASINKLVNVYPNPNNGEFTLTLNNVAMANIIIYNVLGEVVYNTIQTSANSIIRLTNIANGTYMLKATTGTAIYTHKLFINN